MCFLGFCFFYSLSLSLSLSLSPFFLYVHSMSFLGAKIYIFRFMHYQTVKLIDCVCTSNISLVTSSMQMSIYLLTYEDFKFFTFWQMYSVLELSSLVSSPWFLRNYKGKRKTISKRLHIYCCRKILINWVCVEHL